jgi:cytochrome c556
MRIAVLTALASVSLVACGQNAAPTNNSIADNATNSTEATENAVIPAAAPATKEEALKIMHERHEGMEQIGKSTKAIKRQLNSSTPDVAEIQKAAATIAELAAKSPNWFPQGTGPDVGKTGAKPEIWQNYPDFAAKDRDFEKAAQAFDAAAKTGDLTQIKAGFADLGKSCKACHDKYRSDMHH